MTAGPRGRRRRQRPGPRLSPGTGGQDAVMQDPTPERAEESRAGASAEGGGAFCLQRVFEEVQGSSQLSAAPAEPPAVTVVAVERYLAQAPPAAPRQYWYDVTLADGARRHRCHLAPRLNGLVQRARLRAGTRLRLTRCSYRYDEKRLNRGFICLEGLERAAGSATAAPGTPLDGHRPLQPLRGDNRHYLPLWNNEDPYGDVWVADRPPVRVDVDVSKLTSLGHLEMTWRSRVHFHPLLVRILHKSRLRYYGKPEKKMDMPYQAYFEVADGSGMMSMVLWNSLCPEWYHSMKVGTVLLIAKYTIKTSYPFKTQPTPGDSQMKRFATIEINLNVRDPPTEISIIPEEMVKPEWGLPEVKYRFITRSELDDLPQNHSCDVIGLVTFVGRAERARKREHSEDFWLYRWAHAIDGTSDQPFILELFATSQPDVFEHIHPMTYLVCTQMRVMQGLTENPSRTVYLTTSNESQIFITGWHKGQPYTKDAKVKNFIQWMKSQSEADQIKKTVIGGYYPFPRPPDSFLKYCKSNEVESVLKPIGEIGKEIEDLHYREHKRIAVQGIISAIRCISCNDAAEEAPGEELVQKDTSQSLGSSSVSKEDCVDKGKNEEVKSFLGPPCSPVGEHQHKALLSKGSSVKRQTTRRFRRDAEHLDEYQHGHSVQDKNGQAVSDSLQHCTDQEGVSNILETEETGRNWDSWQSDLWTQVKDKLMNYFHHSKIFPESIPCKFDYAHKDLLTQQYNLHAAVHQPIEARTDKNINEFESANGLGYYEVTVLGINHDIAIDVAFLPLFCPDNPHLFQLEDIQNDTLLSCMSSISACQQKATSSGRLRDTFPLSDEIVKAAEELDGKHVICILDICHLGDDKVEVFLSKIYKTVEPGVLDPV
ncbi:RPA-related protein RADX isoform X2 [Oenanthe melanoleuca]|uniref:RPA-related protein RADX isoform X2 n=1 Tax=Oenanthe melanoleuca TaxID=2939378 RepID=UPI0024C18182|nr:RPA-related protein RADX isoform X2 [Oenanthe melanoleuca]